MIRLCIGTREQLETLFLSNRLQRLSSKSQRVPTTWAIGAPLAELQMTQASIADMVLDIDSSALLVYRSAWAKDGGQDRVTREAAMAKLHSTEQAQKVIDRAVQLFGGLGVTSGQVVERLYREIRSLRIYEGASEVQKVIIARNEYKRFSKRSGKTRIRAM